MERALLTFVGFHDPCYKSPVDGVDLKGPILHLLGLRPFDRVHLFTAVNTLDIAKNVEAAAAGEHPGLAVETHVLPIDDPTDYAQIMRGLRSAFREIRERAPEASYFISAESGTPQMHAVWLALSAGGGLSARILQTRPPRFVTADRPVVEEIDPRGILFPDGLEHALEELGIAGRDPAFREAIEIAAQLAPHPVPVLILGETGTGKEMAARLIHRLSGRPAEKFEAVHCAVLPRKLVESELFGHRKGAFAGASADRKGRFEMADGGTLLLDEVGELPAEVQARLLRVLQDGMVQPLGAQSATKVDVRLVSSTSRDLAAAVREKTFREDLYERIHTGTVRLPPLRERRGDIPLLALETLNNLNSRRTVPLRFSTEALRLLSAKDWRGNVQELKNVVERSAVLCKGGVILETELHLSDALQSGDGRYVPLPELKEGFQMDIFLLKMKSRLIARALELSGGNRAAAARLLGITPQAIVNRERRGEA